MNNFFVRNRYFFLALIVVFVAHFTLTSKIKEFLSFEDVTSATVILPQNKTFSMLVVGDMMLDRNVSVLMKKNGFDFPFAQIKDVVSSFGVAVANLEGVYTDNPSVAVSQNEILRFTFDPESLPALKESGFDVLSQANNHTNDFGIEGYNTSKQYLQSTGLVPVGDYFNRTGYFVNKKNKVALIAFNQFAPEGKDLVLEQVKKASEEGLFVIVFPHWGEEYQRNPNRNQKALAYEWIDNGADMVLGSHPHVIQTLEEYKGKLIVYSLGNFIFDQYFSKETQEGLAVSLLFNKKQVSFELMPIDSKRSVPEVMETTDALLLLDALTSESSIPDEWKQLLSRRQKVTISR